MVGGERVPGGIEDTWIALTIQNGKQISTFRVNYSLTRVQQTKRILKQGISNKPGQRYGHYALSNEERLPTAIAERQYRCKRNCQKEDGDQMDIWALLRDLAPPLMR